MSPVTDPVKLEVAESVGRLAPELEAEEGGAGRVQPKGARVFDRNRP